MPFATMMFTTGYVHQLPQFFPKNGRVACVAMFSNRFGDCQASRLTEVDAHKVLPTICQQSQPQLRHLCQIQIQLARLTRLGYLTTMECHSTNFFAACAVAANSHSHHTTTQYTTTSSDPFGTFTNRTVGIHHVNICCSLPAKLKDISRSAKLSPETNTFDLRNPCLGLGYTAIDTIGLRWHGKNASSSQHGHGTLLYLKCYPRYDHCPMIACPLACDEELLRNPQ